GDIIPFVRLAAGLIEQGHEPVLVTHQPYESYARRIGAEFVPIDNTADYAEHMVRSTDLLRLRSAADLRLYYEQNGLFDQLRLECDTLAAWHRPGDTVLVGRYSTGLSVLVAAEVLDAAAAWVAVSPTQLMTSRVSEFYITTGLGPEIDRVRAAYG